MVVSNSTQPGVRRRKRNSTQNATITEKNIYKRPKILKKSPSDDNFDQLIQNNTKSFTATFDKKLKRTESQSSLLKNKYHNISLSNEFQDLFFRKINVVNKPFPRGFAAMTANLNSIYMYGGTPDSKTLYNDFWTV